MGALKKQIMIEDERKMLEVERKYIQAVTVDVTYGCNLRCKN